MIREIKVSYTRVVNITNFENIRIKVELIEQIPEKDKRSNEDRFQKLYAECEDFVELKAEEILND